MLQFGLNGILRRPTLLVVCALALACVEAGAQIPAKSDELPDIVATVQGKPISAQELLTAAREELLPLERQRYEVLEKQLNELIARRLLELEAEQRSVTVEALVQKEIAEKSPEITPEQVKQFYEANKNRMGGHGFEQIEGRLVAYLQQQVQSKRQEEFLSELAKRYPVAVAMLPPLADVSADDDPVLGAKEATITVIEFSDFQCPYCRQVQPTVKRLLEEYQGKVKLVFRDFPLRNIHPQAQKAAEAAQCAADQQQFWPYHDKLFASSKLNNDDLKQYAQEVGLNIEKFNACLESGTHATEVEKDLQDGQKAGVRATPTFFINGRQLSGAASYERFKALIEAALQREAQRTN